MLISLIIHSHPHLNTILMERQGGEAWESPNIAMFLAPSSITVLLFTFDMIWYIFVNCNWVATRWQQYSTHSHTNNTQNDTKQTIHKTTQKLGRVRVVPRLCGLYPGICLTTEKKARENLDQGSHTKTYNKNT